jgi:hypothetical protein
MVMRFFRGLFGAGEAGGETAAAEASVEYNGYTITPAPEKGPNGWRIVGTISREIGGEVKVYHLGRADTSTDREAIVAMTIEKARRVIDEQGERLFTER